MIPADQAVDALMEMALAQASCRRCEPENVFPGLSNMFAFI